MPSMIRMPVASCQASDRRRQRLAGRDAAPQRAEPVADAERRHRAVGGRRREAAPSRRSARSRRAARPARPSRAARSTRRRAAGTCTRPPRPNVKASGGVPMNTSSARRPARSRARTCRRSRARRGGSASCPSAGRSCRDVNAISTTSSAAVSQAAKPSRLRAAARRADLARTARASVADAPSTLRRADGRRRARARSAPCSTISASSLRAQQRHRRHDDAAGLDHGEPAGDEHRRVGRRAAARGCRGRGRARRRARARCGRPAPAARA